MHRIVALVFLDNTQNKPQVNHKDANKENNTITNLEWVTRKENMQHSSENRLHPKTKYCCILDEKDIILDVFKSYNDAWNKNKNNNLADIIKSCKGIIQASKGVRFRHYNSNTKTFIKTDYDLGLKKFRGKYNK